MPISCFYPNWIRSLFSKTPSVVSRNKCTHLGNVLWQHVVRDKVFIAELWSRMLLELRGNPNLRHYSFSSEFQFHGFICRIKRADVGLWLLNCTDTQILSRVLTLHDLLPFLCRPCIFHNYTRDKSKNHSWQLTLGWSVEMRVVTVSLFNCSF